MKTDSATPIDSGFDLPPAAAGAEPVDLQAFGRMMEGPVADGKEQMADGTGVSPSAMALAVPPELALAFHVIAQAAKQGNHATLTPAQAVALADWQRRAWTRLAEDELKRRLEALREVQVHGATGTTAEAQKAIEEALTRREANGRRRD